MLKKSGIYLLSGSILIAVWSISLNSPPDPIGPNAPDTVFSSERAAMYLNEICQRPHSTGTAENKRVREYIVQTCREFGLETEIQNTTAVNRRAAAFQGSSAVYSANVYNVVARLRGTGQTGKSVMVMAHFDSQPNTPGAGDDGASVAAMLETIHNLKASGKTFMNDIVFLFTDAEELGMLGAVGFAQDSVRLKEIGLLLNFDNRGNSGPLNMFETNPENGWVVEHFLKAAAHPFGNSLGYEIYRVLPNDTDFSIFRRAGISGLNEGFIYGYVNYHSPTDKPEDLDRGSLQHAGDNMLSLVKHFGNTSLENTKADNVSYFAIAGEWIVRHPASWNPVLLVICVLMVLAYIGIAWNKKQITAKGVLTSILAFIALIVLLFLTGILLSLGIGALYPSYRNFYSNNSYNAVFYQVSIVAAGLFIFTQLYKFILKKFSLESVMSGVMIMLSIILILLYQVIPTAVFFVMFPLMLCAGGCIAALYKTNIFIVAASSLLSLWWFSSLIEQIFVVFGITVEVGGVLVILALMLTMMIPVFNEIFKSSGAVTGWLSVSVFLVMFIIGHFTSGFSEKEPMQTYLSYQVQADEGKASWVTSRVDDWNREFFPQPIESDTRISNNTELVWYDPPVLEVVHDSTVNNTRILKLHCSTREEAISIRVAFSGAGVTDVAVIGPAGGRGNDNRLRGNFFTVNYAGLDSAGFDMVVETETGKTLEVTLTDRSLGLPFDAGKGYRPDVIPGTGSFANTVQVTKTFQVGN